MYDVLIKIRKMSFIFNNLRKTTNINVINQLSNAIRTISIKSPTPALPADATTEKSENEQKHEVFEKVNNLLKTNTEGRLFAVVQLCGKQFKITTGDIILVEGYWPPTIGDKIRLDKVLLAGGEDFTLVGRPILKPGLVDVQATIIEKALSHTRTHFKKKRRKQYMRINFQRSPNTMIRINSIEFKERVNEKPQSEEFKVF